MKRELKKHLNYYKYLEFIREKSLNLKNIQRDIFKLVLQNYDLNTSKDQISKEIAYINKVTNDKIKKEDYTC